MTTPLRQIRYAAEHAERAAWTCQRAGFRQGADDHLMVSDWQDVIDMLHHAAKPLTDPADRGGWYWTNSAVSLGVFTVVLTTALLWIPDPQRPAPLAVSIVASSVLAAAAGQIFAGVRTARVLRRRTAGIPTWSPTAAVAEIRSDLAAIRVSLATRLGAADLEAAQRIELTQGRLDRLERRVESEERWDRERPSAHMISVDPSQNITASRAPVDPAPEAPAQAGGDSEAGGVPIG